MRTFGIALLTVLTLGIFKSVYRRLVFPFNQLFLAVIAVGYSFLLALGAFCAVAYQLRIISEQFTDMHPLLSSLELGYAIFGALFASAFVTLSATLSWYFNEQTLWERAQTAGQQVAGWVGGQAQVKGR